MNPALLILVVLCLAGFGLRRKGIGLAFALSGLSGILLLSPALLIPDGVPSPAATLSQVPPWQEVSYPNQGNPNLVDVTFQIQPWLLFLRHELRDGRLPFWNPYQFSGEPFWSNGQGAPLFPLHLLFALLPVQLGLVLLPWLRIVTGGVGAFLLARSLALDQRAALVATVVYPLSGMVTGFLLYPMGNALALVPWVLWSVERLAQGRSGWRLLGALSGIQLLAGHPETPLFVGILSSLYLVVRVGFGNWRVWAHFAAGWMVGLSLAAVQILPLAATILDSSRWLEPGVVDPIPLATKFALFLRLVFPHAFGLPAAGTWWGPFNDIATAIYAGALTIPLAVLGFTRVRSDRRWTGMLVFLVFSLGSAYHLPIFKEILLGLPILSHALHHYLKFAVELGLALFAAAGFDLLIRGRGRQPLIVGSAILVGLLGIGWAFFLSQWSQRDHLTSQGLWTAWALGCCLFLWLLASGGARRQSLLWHWVPLLLALDLVAAHRPVNPGLSVASLYPPTGAVDFLQGQEGRVAGLGAALRPNAAMVYRVRDIRGDSPLKLHRYQERFARIAARDPVHVQPVRDWEDPFLDTLGTRWVVAGPEEPAPLSSWHLAYEGRDARVYERPTAHALVRWKDAAPGSELSAQALYPGAWAITWQSPEPAELLVAEVWDRGWRATNGHGPVPIEIREGCLLGIEVGSGQGRLDLRYRPWGLEVGAGLGFLALVGLFIPARWWWGRTRPPAATRDNPAP